MTKEFQTRRNFLKIAGIGASSVAFSKTILAQRTGGKTLNEKLPPNYIALRAYSGLLRLHDEFDFSSDKKAPKFQYEFSHPELHRLREAYKLDRIAGTGDEFSKAM